MAVLAGGRVLDTPWYTSDWYAKAAVWNCTSIRIGLTARPQRIAAIDLDSLGPDTIACLTGYDIGPPLSGQPNGVIRLLTRRP